MNAASSPDPPPHPVPPHSTPAGRPAVGRLAPSPTGAQHLGNARTYLAAWLSARARMGKVVLRVEDLDDQRSRPEYVEQVIDDLRWLGLDWDEGPDVGGPHGPYLQSQRRGIYDSALDRLQAAELVYPCTCTRAELASIAGAPHVGEEGPIYPGTCSARRSANAPPPGGTPYSWRFRLGLGEATFRDGVAGVVRRMLDRDLGDFVVAKAGGAYGYQLAVTVDDHLMGATEVVRGDDLVASAFRQQAIYAAFGWEPPRFFHLPLVTTPDGRRLAKRRGDVRIAHFRERGVSPDVIVGLLGWSCGWLPTWTPARPVDLLPYFSWDAFPRRPFVLEEAFVRRAGG